MIMLLSDTFGILKLRNMNTGSHAWFAYCKATQVLSFLFPEGVISVSLFAPMGQQ